MKKYNLKENWLVLISEIPKTDRICDILYDEYTNNLTIYYGETVFCFSDVITYNVIANHCQPYSSPCFTENDSQSATFVKVKNSNFIKWIEDAGYEQIHGLAKDVVHYKFISDNAIVDIAIKNSSLITINDKVLYVHS